MVPYSVKTIEEYFLNRDTKVKVTKRYTEPITIRKQISS